MHLADVLHRRHIFIVVFQRVEGVRVGGDDALHARGLDGLHVVVAQGHEQRFFAEAPDFVSAVFFRRAENAEVRSNLVENPAVARPIDCMRSS